MARATRSCPVLRRHAACALLACLVLVAPGAPAAAPSVQPLVARQLAAIRAARGPEAYAALRELWQAWEEIDPVQVEEALTAVAEDGALGAPLRAYAGALRAHARWRRGDRQGAELAIRRLGFVTEWLVVGPFDNEGKGGLGQAFVPEQELGEPVLLERAYQGKQRPVRWRPSPPVHPHGWLDLGALVRPRTKVCAYAATFLRQAAGTGRAAAPRQLSLWVGATGAFRLFWNEQAVLEDKSYRDLDVDRFAVAVPLEPGHNRLTVKVCADDSPPAVAVRVAEPDGSPATGIEAS
ncbi:MAG: hypothetical protein HY744_16885, partial [Deltaproteobacteria bacterium]|nr:hypothetical protein [Deltaproteobacteria bacterium]